MESSTEYIKFFAALLAIVNPVGAIPIFINLTSGLNEIERKGVCRISALATGLILVVVLFTGEMVLRFFGITIASFRVGGGILILLMSLSMLHAQISRVRQTKEEALASEERDSIAVVPLATPLLAGPGAISTVILYAQRQSTVGYYLILASEIALLALLIWFLFRLAPFIANLLGTTGINVVTRLMGLVMAAVGVEFIANGLRQLFPVLAG
ncbi:MAG: YchE family NAAT transporter [Proteobacteria bacterium]|nr:YchE family NAAT transporter [Pseudomonadota bacterium]MBU1716795.1 YchE family NAAT transporter [Pseudomonadota bacterium]